MDPIAATRMAIGTIGESEVAGKRPTRPCLCEEEAGGAQKAARRCGALRGGEVQLGKPFALLKKSARPHPTPAPAFPRPGEGGSGLPSLSTLVKSVFALPFPTVLALALIVLAKKSTPTYDELYVVS